MTGKAVKRGTWRSNIRNDPMGARRQEETRRTQIQVAEGGGEGFEESRYCRMERQNRIQVAMEENK